MQNSMGARPEITGGFKVFQLIGLSLGYFMVLLDTTVVTVALPAIREQLGGGLTGLQWVVNAYTLVFAGLLLSMGAWSDRLGAKRVYMAGLAIFLIGSILAAASPTLGLLIALRAVLGVGGAALLPASLALISGSFPSAAERARALGWWAAVTGVAMAAGPVVGGLLVDTLGWRSIFLLQVPIALLSMIMTAALVSSPPRRLQQGTDAWGQVTMVLAMFALSFALMEGQQLGWGSKIIIAAWVIAAGSVIGFIRIEARSRTPILPLHIFRSSAVGGGMAAGFIINFALSGMLFILPLYFQQAIGLPAHAAGLSLLPMTIPMAFNPIMTGKLVGRIGARGPMTFGFLLTAAGTLIQIEGIRSGSQPIIGIGLLIVGFGVSLAIPSLMTAVISAVPKPLTGVTSGALNSSRQLGAVLGVVFIGFIAGANGSLETGLPTALWVCVAVLLAGAAISFASAGGGSTRGQWIKRRAEPKSRSSQALMCLEERL